MGLIYRATVYGRPPTADSQPDQIDITAYSPVSIAAFKELVQRGANLWPDAPAEIKEFADLVTSGQVLQDYKAQEQKRKITLNPAHGAPYGNPKNSDATTDSGN